MRKLLICIFATVFGAVFVASAKAQDFPTSTLQIALTDAHAGKPVSGTLTLSTEGIHFESRDFIFDLPMPEIKKLEVQGARKNFATFVIHPKSSLITQQRTLLQERNDPYGRSESILVVSLETKEDLAKSLASMKKYQAVIQAAKEEEAKQLVGEVPSGAGPQAAYPFVGKTIRAFVIDHRNDGRTPVHGYLTFFENRVQFASDEVTFSIPITLIQKVECAGARETFLSLHVNPKAEFFHLYADYLRHEGGAAVPVAKFELDVEEDVRQSFATATQFQKYMNDVMEGRINAMIAASAVSDSASGPSSAPALSPASGQVDASAPQIEKHEIARYNAAFVEKFVPKAIVNRFKVINGVRGQLIIFDAGIGYVSEEASPHVKVQRQQYFQNGHLKFFIPAAAVISAQNVSVIRDPQNPPLNSYMAEIAVDQNSEFFRSHAALMSESSRDNVLYLLFQSQQELEQYLSVLQPNTSVNQF